MSRSVDDLPENVVDPAQVGGARRQIGHLLSLRINNSNTPSRTWNFKLNNPHC